jgi:ubiquinone/menaquinone biosynthesis C-methylase UbiE
MTDQSPSQDSTQKAHVQEQFARTAEEYVTSRSHRQGWDLTRLIELGEWGPTPTLQALDIATGGGHTALAVAPHVAQVIASDLTPRMLETARAFLETQGITNARFVEADAEQLPFETASFDRVTCRIAPHHFPNVGQFVNEVARVLKPDGLFLLIDCISPGEKDLDAFDNTVEKWRDLSHGRSYTKEEWFNFFQQAGLIIEHSETFRKTHDYDDWTARSHLPATEKIRLASFMLQSAAPIQEHFAIQRKADGTLASFTTDFILVKVRKKAS